ncbi:hypothetical protein TrVFT333_004550 [Trichoderma virens FT-333]|nr:hypothetical protein TrVFT333_004550 [Trichoderma virens FT-333]
MPYDPNTSPNSHSEQDSAYHTGPDSYITENSYCVHNSVLGEPLTVTMDTSIPTSTGNSIETSVDTQPNIADNYK